MCGGNGVFETTSLEEPQLIAPCPSCGGAGYHETGKIDGKNQWVALKSRLDGIDDKVDAIAEKLNE